VLAKLVQGEICRNALDGVGLRLRVFPICGNGGAFKGGRICVGLELRQYFGIQFAVIHQPLYTFCFVYIHNVGHTPSGGSDLLTSIF